MRWVIEMAMEPPLVECVVYEWSNGAVVVRESVVCNVKAPHTGMPDRYHNNLMGRNGGISQRLTDMTAHQRGEGKDGEEYSKHKDIVWGASSVRGKRRGRE